MPDSNLENQLQVDSNPRVERPTDPNGEEQYFNWFALFLKYQAQSNAFFEYLIMEYEKWNKIIRKTNHRWGLIPELNDQLVRIGESSAGNGAEK